MIKQHKGKRVEESLGTSNKRLAEKFYSEKLTSILDGSYWQPKQRAVTFRELASKYLEKSTNQRDPYSASAVLKHFGGMVAHEIDIECVEDWIQVRMEEVAMGTLKQEFAFCRAMYNVARKKWRKELMIRENPFSDAGMPAFCNERKRFASREEEAALYAAAQEQWVKDIILFALHTGCRRSEILLCDVKKNINMKDHFIKIQATKGGNEKTIPMSSMLYSMIERRLKVVSNSGKLFNVSASAVRYAFDQAREGAGISDLHFHDLRHTYGSRLYHMGVDLYTIKKLMGHKSLKMTERYVHENLQVLQPSAIALDKFYDNSTTANEVANLPKVEKLFNIS